MSAIGLLGIFSFCTLEDIRKRSFDVMYLILFAISGIIVHIYTQSESIYSLLGGAAVGGILYIVSILSDERIGKGDAMLVIVAGIYSGFWNTIVLLFVACLLSSIYGIILLTFEKKAKTYRIPFAPFLLGAYLLLLITKYTLQYW